MIDAKDLLKTYKNAPAFILAVAYILDDTTGGTSAALYSIFLHSLVSHLKNLAFCNDSKVGIAQWASALSLALEALYKYTPARQGDRTLMDTLIPFVSNFNETHDLGKAADASMKGAESTRTLENIFGRVSYLDSKYVHDQNVPDAGAWGLAFLLKGLAEASE